MSRDKNSEYILRTIDNMEKDVIKRAKAEENARRNELKRMSRKELLIELNVELAGLGEMLTEMLDEHRINMAEEIKKAIAENV